MRSLLIAAGLILAACTTTAASSPPAPEAPDLCKASEYQWLVGRKREELPPKPEGAVWRIACTQCPVTMDYNPARLNVFFDEATEVIKEVRCG